MCTRVRGGEEGRGEVPGVLAGDGVVYDHGAGEPSAETSGTAAGLPASAKGCTKAPVLGVIGVNMEAGVWAGVCRADIGVSVLDGPKS